MKRHEIVPLLDVANYSDTVTCLDLDIPNVEPETLGVDIHRLHRVMHWGGIGRLAIGSYEGDTTQYTANAVRLNPDGTLSGTGMKVASKAKLAAHESENLGQTSERLFQVYDWRNTAIYLNTTTLGECSEEPNGELVRRTDKVLRSSLRQEIASNELSPRRVAKEAILALLAVGISEASHVVDGNLLREIMYFMAPKYPWPLGIFAISKTFAQGDSEKTRQLTGNDKIGPKYSTMFSWRFDRVLMANKNLIKPIITSLTDAA